VAAGEHVAPFEPGEELTEQPRQSAMVYVLDTPLYEWDRVPRVSHELVEKQIQGLPLQSSDIPAEPQLAGPFDVPDICIPTDGFLFVSDRGRAALEELAPGCVAFFPIDLKAPERMRPAKAYFFIEVLPRAQCIDWDRSETVRRIVRAPDGRESRAIRGSIWNRSTKVKAVSPDMPKIWREVDVDRPAVHFFEK
jgi:hypothetical protein